MLHILLAVFFLIIMIQCDVRLFVSFSGDITALVLAEMLAGALVLGTILTILPGNSKMISHMRCCVLFLSAAKQSLQCVLFCFLKIRS